MTRQFTLSSADLNKSELRRDFVTDPAGQDATFRQAYDRTTLWYDAFWRDGRVILVCPSLKNFAPLIRAAEFKLDGRPAKIARMRHYPRHDVIELKSSVCPAEISASGEGFEVATPVTKADLDRFAGLNTHFTMSLDNDPQWIRDFALFHRRTQGLQAMVLFDNGSTRYPLSAIEEVLQGVGLADFIIVSAPLPYGRNAKGTQKKHEAKFLHSALINIARLRFLGRARAVLNADIDELVWTEGGTVFDKAVNSWAGYAAYSGEWRYPAHDQEPSRAHGNHDHICEVPAPCPRKYCISPRWPLGGLNWDVHRVNGVPFSKLHGRKDVGYLHCARISTEWKGAPRMTNEMNLRRDPRTRALLDRAFSNQNAMSEWR